MRDRLPSGSTTNNNGTPRRLSPLITARRHPWKGWRLRVITTEVGTSWEWVVCGVFVREHSPCRAFEVGSAPDRRSVRAVIKMWLDCPVEETDNQGRRTRTNRGARQAARHSAALLANIYMRRFVLGWKMFGLERSPRLLPHNLRGRPRDLVQNGQSRSGLAKPARDHGQAEADGERGEDTDLQSARRRVRLPGIHVRANVFGEDGQARIGYRPSKKSFQRVVEKVHALKAAAAKSGFGSTAWRVGQIDPIRHPVRRHLARNRRE